MRLLIPHKGKSLLKTHFILLEKNRESLLQERFQLNQKKVAIIGAGMVGLSAGCYLQMSGRNTAQMICKRDNVRLIHN